MRSPNGFGQGEAIALCVCLEVAARMFMTIQPDIRDILSKAGLGEHESAILRISEQMTMEFEPACNNLIKIDATIPGVGLHNVKELSPKDGRPGAYHITDRAIFRPIQYVVMHFRHRPLDWFTRDIVRYSCLHVESSLKRRLDEKRCRSMGMILKNPEARTLDSNLHNILELLNKFVYNRAKHTIEQIDLNSHMFSVADSIAIYLTCRIVGAQLLRGMGITTTSGVSVF